MNLFKKFKDVPAYLIFGVCTTVINIVVYAVLYHSLGVANLKSTFIAWLLSVIFAFISNKLFVFGSKSWNAKTFFMNWQHFSGAEY